MRIVFITTMTGYPWGGSEELWSRAAARLADAGHQVSVFTEQTPPLSPKFTDLAAHGIALKSRTPPKWGMARSLWRRLTGLPPRHPEKAWLLAQNPDLVVISQGSIRDGFSWMHFCKEEQLPYLPIVHCNAEIAWPSDDIATSLASAYAGATQVCCVSQHNLRLLEFQLGKPLPNARVVWNPTNLASSELLLWPESNGVVRIASVGRLEPGSKGQDVIFQVLAQPVWRRRPVELNLYGAGPFEKVLRKMTASLQLANVHFRGHVANVADIWRNNHLLAMPSRQEGLPLTLVEAMFCGRPAVVTDVGGNAELCVDGETGFIASAAAVGPFAEALERAWVRQSDWPSLGQAAHHRIRQIVPADPVGDFCELLAGYTNKIC